MSHSEEDADVDDVSQVGSEGTAEIVNEDAGAEEMSEGDVQNESDIGSKEKSTIGAYGEFEDEIDDDFLDYDFEEAELGEISEVSSKLDEMSIRSSETPSLEEPIATNDRLDRDKLISAIHEAFIARHKEERKNALLNKKLAEYFRRKKSTRALHDDNTDMVFDHMNKYRELLFKLNKIKGQEEVLKQQSEQKINELKEEDQALKDETAKNIVDLNKILQDVGITCQSAKTGTLLSEKIVEKYIRKMNVLREQISTVRLELLKTQDKVTAVHLKTKQLEDLGDGLKVINFEQLRAETQSLSDKIEERNNELTKLRRHCNSDIHVLAHVRDKQFMLSNAILVQEGVLRDLQHEETSCRNYLNRIKLERDQLRKKLKEMSFECGLLDKPALQRGYDRTIEHIAKVKDEVDVLQTEKDRIVEELKVATLRAESQMGIKTDMQKFDEALQQQLADMNKLPYPRIKQGIIPVRMVDLSRYRSNWRK